MGNKVRNFFDQICPTFLLYGKDTLKAANRARLTAEREMPLTPLIQRMQIRQQPKNKQNNIIKKVLKIIYKLDVKTRGPWDWVSCGEQTRALHNLICKLDIKSNIEL